MISQEVGQGLPFWLPNGATIRRTLEGYITDKESAFRLPARLYATFGFCRTLTRPQVTGIIIQKTCFQLWTWVTGEEFVLRPMNCPHHIHVYKNHVRSYRELPVRIAELRG